MSKPEGIIYLGNGSIDFTHTSQDDYNRAIELVQPIQSIVESHTNYTVDIWKFFSSLFVGYYWFVLDDQGASSLIPYTLEDREISVP